MKVSIGRQVREALDKLQAADPGQALIQALLAVAATSKRKYRQKKDNEAFKEFVKESMGVITSIGLGHQVAGVRVGSPSNKKRDLEEVLYDIRCHLMHDLTLPNNVQFTDNTIGGDATIQLPKSLIYGLIAAVVTAPVNSHERILPEYVFIVYGEPAIVNDYWGKATELLDWLDSVRKSHQCDS